ncbi:rho GTPase-activating protein 40-like isoform X2 [Salvelinus fontinalis]|uniref:rho GTPase-activating protein 40-like isoform X2 n=1 Tax=Salvelinus fontinalis TaxID=8038 RepID=UPI002485AD49|nr:rho GTPase-activating protein 40-like isoform X2 [Salvelinus fontinalis]
MGEREETTGRMPLWRSVSRAKQQGSGKANGPPRPKARSPSPSEMNGEPWARPRYQDQAAAEHCIASHQDQQQHPDKLCLDSFWSEVETIRSQGSGYTDLDTDSARRDSRHSEEGEQEERWLQDAGLSTLIRQQQQRPDRDRDRDRDSEDQDVDQAILLSTLTRTQAAAVQRRLDSYTLSLRKRRKPVPRDVREIFSSSNSSIAQTPLPECQEPEPTEPKSSLPECQDPEPTEPKSSLPECQDPEPTEPKSSLPECQDPEPTEPKSSLPECQDPEPTEPKSSLPECQDPEPTEPKSSLSDDSMETINKTPLQEVSLDQQKKHGGAPKEEIFITDVAYCEQAAILLKQAKLTQMKNSCKRKEDGTLPRVICPQCRLGVTRIQDLSNQDMKKVRQLALIDMTALCDLLELDVKRHKTCKRKIPESALFGVPLATLLENDQKVKSTATTPLILQALLWFLEKRGVDSEGILRVSGSQSRIKKLQQDLEQNFYSGGFSWDEVSPNDVAALLKKFIRELPSPLLTAEHLNTFSAARDIPELKQKLHVLNLLILLLPEPNRNTLKALLEFLSKVVSRERRNRMNLWAVSTIMAPNLFLFLHKAVPSRLTDGGPGVEKGHAEKAPNLLLHKAVPSRLTDGGPGEEKGHAEKAADIMRLLIRYQDLLWTIPNFLMSQVRKLNENSNRRYQFYDRRIKNLLRKIHQERKDKPDKDSSEPCRTVKIQMGELMSSTMEVKVNINSRASDLLAQFHRHLYTSDSTKGLLKRNGLVNDLGSYPDCAMYEVGGNIGEHCLDPQTHLLDLYNNNPSGEWVIKPKPLTTSRGLQI